MFDKGGHVPDASVVYDGGRYQMIYDWGESDFNREGGIAYAWADRPEGPWHRASEPITRRTTTRAMGGKFSDSGAAHAGLVDPGDDRRAAERVGDVRDFGGKPGRAVFGPGDCQAVGRAVLPPSANGSFPGICIRRERLCASDFRGG